MPTLVNIIQYSILYPIPQGVHIINVSHIFINFREHFRAKKFFFAKMREQKFPFQHYWQLNSNITTHVLFIFPE
jgi:hypothetical protein